MLCVGGALFVGIIVFVMSEQTEAALERERDRSEALLRNILPAPIAERLKTETRTIADGFETVTVAFADIAGFTELSQKLEPARLVALLDRVFTEFDQLAERHGLEKI